MCCDDCFLTTLADLSRCDRDHMAHKVMMWPFTERVLPQGDQGEPERLRLAGLYRVCYDFDL